MPRVEQPYFWPREAGDELGGFHWFPTVGGRGHARSIVKAKRIKISIA